MSNPAAEAGTAGAAAGEKSAPAELAQWVARLRADAAVLAAEDVADVDAVRAGQLHRDLRGAIDQLGVVAARLLAVVEADGRWQAGSARTFPEWVARRQGTSIGAARQEAQLGQALDSDIRATGAAVADGSISLEHAQVLARFGPTTPTRKEALASDQDDRNEAFLLDKARTMPVDDYRREVKRWAIRVDAQAADREHQHAAAKEYLTLARRDDGVALQGFLTTEHGTALTTALRAITGVPARDDTRTPQERDAHALTGMTRLVLDKGMAGGGAQVRPHLSVHVSWETLQNLADTAGTHDGPPAELDTGEPLPPSVLARIACDSEMTRIVFGPDGHVVDVGRAHRTYTGQLRRAVIARDRRCQHPGCTAPPKLGEIHHVVGWANGGPTSAANGILLCWYHHDLVHRRHQTITRNATGWTFRRSDGTPLTETPRGSPPACPQEPPADAPMEAAVTSGTSKGADDVQGQLSLAV